MKVGQLIQELSQYDEDCEVLIVSQPNWPFEYSVRGVVSRRDAVDRDDEDAKGSDVFLVEGSQLRYGSKRVFEAV